MSRVGMVALAAMGLAAAASCGSRSSIDDDLVDASVPGTGGSGDGGSSFGVGGVIGGFGGSSTIGGGFGAGGVPAGGGAPGRGGSPGAGGVPGAGGIAGRGGSPGAGGILGRGGSFGAGGIAGRGGAGGAGGSFGTGGTGTAGRAGAGGMGGTGILPILPGVIPTQGCINCVNQNCNGTTACASDPVCVRGLNCTFTNCTANGAPPTLPCVLACFLGDIQAAGVALRDALCVYTTCGPSCTITAP